DRPLCHLSHPISRDWQGGGGLNPQPTVLETATLPIELPPYSYRILLLFHRTKRRRRAHSPRFRYSPKPGYSSTSVTRPAPMVRPPSRIAKRWPLSIATGAITVMSTETLSPGITISTPCGRATVPVTSVVRK